MSKLWEHMHREHGITLLETEETDIETIVNKEQIKETTELRNRINQLESKIAIARTNMIALAARLVCGQSMPSEFASEWGFPKRTPRYLVERVIDRSENARSQCKRWAVQAREIADDLHKPTEPKNELPDVPFMRGVSNCHARD